MNNAGTETVMVQIPIKVFSLMYIDDHPRLTLNGALIAANKLKMKGYSVKPSPIKDGEPCIVCAPKGSGILRKWYVAFIKCNDVSGYIWICSNCGKVNEHIRGGKALWSELCKNVI